MGKNRVRDRRTEQKSTRLCANKQSFSRRDHSIVDENKVSVEKNRVSEEYKATQEKNRVYVDEILVSV